MTFCNHSIDLKEPGGQKVWLTITGPGLSFLPHLLLLFLPFPLRFRGFFSPQSHSFVPRSLTHSCVFTSYNDSLLYTIFSLSFFLLLLLLLLILLLLLLLLHLLCSSFFIQNPHPQLPFLTSCRSQGTSNIDV